MTRAEILRGLQGVLKRALERIKEDFERVNNFAGYQEASAEAYGRMWGIHAMICSTFSIECETAAHRIYEDVERQIKTLRDECFERVKGVC